MGSSPAQPGKVRWEQRLWRLWRLCRTHLAGHPPCKDLKKGPKRKNVVPPHLIREKQGLSFLLSSNGNNLRASIWTKPNGSPSSLFLMVANNMWKVYELGHVEWSSLLKRTFSLQSVKNLLRSNLSLNCCLRGPYGLSRIWWLLNFWLFLAAFIFDFILAINIPFYSCIICSWYLIH